MRASAVVATLPALISSASAFLLLPSFTHFSLHTNCQPTDEIVVEEEEPYFMQCNAVPVTPDGKVCHLGLAPGECANRVVTCGSFSRGEELAALLTHTTRIHSTRGFTTHTGTFEGVAVSIVVAQMGGPNMDFVLRETRQVVEGDMLMIRFGSCAGTTADMQDISLAICNGSTYIAQNPDAWSDPDPTSSGIEQSYRISRCLPGGGHRPLGSLVAPDKELTAALLKELEEGMGDEACKACVNASTDSFYGSQGRQDVNFDDRNQDLIAHVMQAFPTLRTLEMETFFLLHLARLAQQPALRIRAAAVSMVLANRELNTAVAADAVAPLERLAGAAILRAITRFPL
ncbi:unnamed protein product [Chrysoparadoxa australica]